MASVAARDRGLLQALEAARGEYPGMATLLDFHHGVLREQLGVRESLAPPPSLDPLVVAERLERGIPVLGYKELGVDVLQLQRLCLRLAALVADYLPLLDPREAEMAGWGGVARSWYGSRRGLTLRGDAGSEEALLMVAGMGLAPFLESAAAGLPGDGVGVPWRRGYCPACGGEPDFSLLTEEAKRSLMCCRCCTLWEYNRVGCPFCNEVDGSRLSLYPVAEGLYRVYVCRSCGRYLKGVDSRRVEGMSLPLERILTTGIDLSALEAGYAPG